MYKKDFSRFSSTKLLVIPVGIQHEILLACHDDPLTGAHLGIAKTYGRVRERYHWENMYVDVENYVKSCLACQQRKHPPKAPPGLLQPIKVGKPFERVGIDLLGPFPKSTSGNTFIVTAVDYATKWAEAKAIRNGTAKCVAGFIVENLICRFGCPAELLSDRGACFKSKLVTELLRALGTHPTFTTAYHPKTNGLTEHYNGTLDNMLSIYTATDQKDWDLYVPLVTFAYNSAKQESTRETPFMLMYGRLPRFPSDVALGLNEQSDETVNEFVTRIELVRGNALARLEVEQVRRKGY